MKKTISALLAATIALSAVGLCACDDGKTNTVTGLRSEKNDRGGVDGGVRFYRGDKRHGRVKDDGSGRRELCDLRIFRREQIETFGDSQRREVGSVLCC